MTLTSHQLAKELLEMDDLPLSISVDISTCDYDADRRVYTNEYFGPNDDGKWCGEITLLFGGKTND